MTRRGIERLGRAVLLVFATCVFAQGAVVSNGLAIDFDHRGVATLDGAYSEGFEEDLPRQTYMTGGPDGLRYASQNALQGERVMVLEGRTPRVLIEIPRSKFDGQRVNLRLWFRAQGTDATARLVWANRPLDSLNDDVLSLGAARLSPTGRATSDGWIELSTGPVDWEFAAAGGPVGLLISDSQYTRRNREPNESLEVHIDALEIEDLGEAAVPQSDCTLPEENAECGPQGICWIGKCVDAAAALGSVPSGDYREDYLQRRSFLVEQTLAIRRTRPQLDSFQQVLDGLEDATPKSYWTRLVSAWEMLRDGHASPPTNQTVKATSPQGICLGPGKADLLTESSEAPVPMVFDPGSSSLQPGDVLTAIDGMAVADWKHAARRYLYYNGDPDGRRALQVNDVLRAAVLTGARAEFSRCPSEDPCTSAEAVSFELDFSETVGQSVWQGGRPDALDEESGRYCDFRFDALRPSDHLIGTGSAYFSTTQSGIVRAEFFDMPQPRDENGDPLTRWKEKWRENLSDEPDRVMVDQRLGFGGGTRAVHFLGDLFIKAATRMREAGFPWYGAELDLDDMQAILECLSSNSHGDSCGGLFYSGVSDNHPTTKLADDAKLALVTAQAVSGNDFFAKYLTHRDAETRIFGYSPTIGAFGAVDRYPELPGESNAPSFQYHDTRFVTDEQSLAESRFSSGKGVAPDETIYQLQSDARKGTDTIIEAARQWLDGSSN